MEYNCTTQTALSGATPSGKSCEVDNENKTIKTMETISNSSQGSAIVDALQAREVIVAPKMGNA
ncbi:MAG: hypothetical protein IKU98_01890, partial [Bacteroidaceae bacterium]|nr:hypothetical protein [Bacteroidaceae bacterium]